MNEHIEAMQRTDVVKAAHDVSTGLLLLSKTAETIIQLALANAEEHRLAERLQHALTNGFVHLGIDRLATNCIDLAATMGKRADTLRHGNEKSST